MFDLSNAQVKHPVSELSTTVSVKSKLIPNDDPTIIPHMLHESWLSPVAAILSITTDQTVLDTIKCRYASDDYCIKISNSSMSGAKCINGFVCKFMVFLGHQLNLAEIPTFEQIIAHSNLHIFARFKGGFNMHFSLLSNTKLNFSQKLLFVKLGNWVRQRYPP
jgi:hypothetical protein